MYGSIIMCNMSKEDYFINSYTSSVINKISDFIKHTFFKILVMAIELRV